MKKSISITLIVTLLLVMIFTQAFASAPYEGQKPKHTPRPNEAPQVQMQDGQEPGKGNPGKGNQDPGQGNPGKGNPDPGQGNPGNGNPDPDKGNPQPGRKYNLKGVIKSEITGCIQNGSLVIGGPRGGTVILEGLTDIKVSGPSVGDFCFEAGQQVMVKAIKKDGKFIALRIHIFPKKAAHVHRVGTVTEVDTVNNTITVTDNKGSTSFYVNWENLENVKKVPAKRWVQVANLEDLMGKRVTIISPASIAPTANGTLVAAGIVIHPDKGTVNEGD